MECYSGEDDSKLMDLVLTVYDLCSHPWPEVWLRDAVEAFNAADGMDFGDTNGGSLMKSISMELLGLQCISKVHFKWQRGRRAVSVYRCPSGGHFKDKGHGVGL